LFLKGDRVFYRTKKRENMIKRKLLITCLSLGAIAAAIIPLATVKTNAAEPGVQFVCSQGFDRDSGERHPTTYIWTASKKIALIRWKKNWGNFISPQQRCEAISPRFQKAYESGTLQFITNGMMNGQPVICTTRSNGGACQTLLMTLRQEENSFKTLVELKELLNGTEVTPVTHSSGTPQVYYWVDIDNLISNAPARSEEERDDE
jgi:hypothetical protein